MLMETNIENLKAPCFFEVSTDTALWWSLVDNFKMNITNYRYGICIQTGEIRKFPMDQMVKKISLNIFRSEK